MARYKNTSSDSEEESNVSSSGRQRGPRDLRIEATSSARTTPPRFDEAENTQAEKAKPVSWRSLPRKDQLLVITLARLSEPLTQTSLGSYLFYQLQSFDPSLPDSTISYQAGIIQAAFPATQFLTAILWGKFADSPQGGRKRVIYIGLLGTMLSIIGFGFSHSFPMAVACRCLGGVLNGNIGVMRTMISEIIKVKKFQSRAFLILPITFNIGVIVGPVLGSILGGKHGVQWMIRWPYALPNLMSAVFLLVSALAVIFFLEETSELCKDNPDHGLRIGRWISRHIFRQHVVSNAGYTAVLEDEWAASSSLELQPTPTTARPDTSTLSDKSTQMLRQKLPFRHIWTRNLIITLFAHGLLAMHVGGFNALWFIYLSTPRYDPSNPHPPGFKPHGFFHFTGGLALPPPRIGLALAILGVIGISLQLFIYPNLSHRLGTANSYRIFLALFPFTYALAPFLSRVPSWSSPPDGVSGPFVWAAIIVVLFIQVLGRTFALPCTAILINNVSPHPSVLGTVHGIGQSVSSLTRTIGPVLFSWVFGRGLDMGVVGMAWWLMTGVAIVGWVVAQGVREGDGHEILLEGEVRGSDGEVRRET
ncbi:MFS general substrate transporter [Dothidotthia symphoricarpi CBS 119687]|uniref:MFS general substrate transporter n=1 Tax=Dothidotthia symphoricarpi CBS 119687 TaxID=1392245 RepID=A0A6A5ZYD3_9PLEO|nr:MFS general substrate transporter [Dothidotthia symphoricarpi CBS 119687]KAF2124035.1 MFS general substrate transporter [Dothidotthia symphoricarpi CBS 119687]